ncbi:ATP synthase subunit C lysine N-methyltransferase-like isoform X2 [Megalobrama amblycephala]|nr:ATP synthase subunit C lysine N-methyltransferase-like isoform X2 [Megalobrama amblycephala]XP_048037286.1 ATP synthase subunit C lysine N-methyltransferase-like isoform X2 [Megalobrama amblycephala]XP_048037287.1 ATP synthase subunit C lysine N-methyltransferase-like isoform X2 [Megalobrama amblycephala]
MEDCIEVILEQRSWFSRHCSHNVTLLIGSAFAGVYGLWAAFCMPGLRVPFRLKVPFLPSTKEQTANVIKLLDGRKGRLADLGSGDGRLVFAASSVGFQCTGFEINSMLLAYSRSKAWWSGNDIHFVKKDFWKTDLSKYRNVTVFLAPAVMGVLEEKLLKELPEDARVIVCRFPFPRWPHSCTAGSGLNQVWAYDVHTARESSRTSPHQRQA